MSHERLPAPIRSEEVAWTGWSAAPRFSLRYRHLTRAVMGNHYHVGVVIEELPPGSQSAPAHFHLFEEEHVYVLAGNPTLRLGDGWHLLKPGDYVCFPAGQKAGHCLVNRTSEVCRYVLVGERNPNEVVVYTDTKKVMVRSLGPRAVFDMKATRTYWDGEDTGLPDGELPPEDVADDMGGSVLMPRPPIAAGEVAREEIRVAERFGGFAQHLTHAAVGAGYRVGVLIEAPDPGLRLAPRHYHMLEEEHAFILEGSVTLLAGDERLEMKAGDYACFPAGIRVGHAFMGGTDGPCRYLMIGERIRSDVCVYPDSDKMAVGALRVEDDIFDMSGRRGYWDGE